MGEERRRYPRCSVRLEAVQQLGNQRLQRSVVNLSAGGFFIEGTGGGLLPGDLVVMEFAGLEGPFRVTAEVAYVAPRGIGVRVTRADWQRLSHLVRSSAAT